MTCKDVLLNDNCPRFKLYECDGYCGFDTKCKYADPAMGGCHAGGDRLMPVAILNGTTKPYTGLEVILNSMENIYDCLDIGQNQCTR